MRSAGQPQPPLGLPVALLFTLIFDLRFVLRLPVECLSSEGGGLGAHQLNPRTLEYPRANPNPTLPKFACVIRFAPRGCFEIYDSPVIFDVAKEISSLNVFFSFYFLVKLIL